MCGGTNIVLLAGPPPDSLRVYPVSVGGGPVCGGTNIVLLSGPPPDSVRVYPMSGCTNIVLLAGPPPDSVRVYPVSVDVPISCCSLVRHLIQ